MALSQPLTILWQHQSADEQTTILTPAAHNGRIYLPLTRGIILSLSSEDGTTAWRAETGGEISASPSADPRGVYVASQTFYASNGVESRATGTLRLLSSATGVTLWMRTLPRPFRGSLVSTETTLYGGTEDGQVLAINKKTGDIIWTFKHTNGFASTPVLHGDQIYIGSTDGTLFSLQQRTGKPLWRYRTRGALRGAVSVAGRLIFFGSVDGYIYALEVSNGKLRWRTRTGAGVQAVALTEEGLIAASFDNFVYSFSPQRGKLQWKRLLAGRIVAQPLATKDGVLFAPLSGDACVVLNPQDGKQLNTLPVGTDNNTGASPIMTGNILIITTRNGVLAFSSPLNDGDAVSGRH
ncbi:MAG: PQQ-binding-like beta-propeller repeat protein [Pyrinomonadaceae bacterium]|nr:PQQ-binding-like beta-propeller repeat protein [Pyrinomonadaceae bacterium]